MGLETPTSDDDQFSVVIPPYNTFMGLGSFKESRHTIDKEANTDIHEITLARLVQSIIKGRVTDIEPLFGAEVTSRSVVGDTLLYNKPAMLSQQMLKPLLGMAQSQHKLAFKGNSDRFNPDIGYDPKAASHCIRALWQAYHLKRFNVLHMKFPTIQTKFREHVMNIKLGNAGIRDVISDIEDWETLVNNSPMNPDLPETVDVEFWKTWLIDAHEDHFGISWL